MENEKKIKTLQTVYAAALADSVLRLEREGVLEKVTAAKRTEQMATGAQRAAQFGAASSEDVFANLVETFGCANWQTKREGNTVTAQATGCMLCALAKRMGAASPCRIYCLDAMEGMVKGLKPGTEFTVEETLYDGTSCRVTVKEP